MLKGSDENGLAVVEMRNRFVVGDELEVLSPGENFNRRFAVKEMFGEDGERLTDAKIVQQKIVLFCPFRLCEGDILRK